MNSLAPLGVKVIQSSIPSTSQPNATGSEVIKMSVTLRHLMVRFGGFICSVSNIIAIRGDRRGAQVRLNPDSDCVKLTLL